MKELVRHIEILLLDHDCVVVPQIGGFVTCNEPARYVEEENLFLPPIRTVRFNERLKADDGLLVRSYMTAYRCPETEARKMLGGEIRDLQQELWENGAYDLGSIGVLTLDGHDDVQFSPCQAGTVCPGFYGLDALFFKPWQAEGAERPALDAAQEKPAHEGKAEDGKDGRKGEITIRVKKSWIQDIAAVAAVVLLFFLIAPEVKNMEPSAASKAEFTQLMWMPAMTEAAPAFAPKDARDGSGAQAMPSGKSVNPETPGKAAAEKAAMPDAVESGYCVVVASAISEKNALHYVERLHKAGHKEAQVYKKGKMVRVVFPGYETESQAYAKMRALGDESEEFASAWVYKIK